MGPLLILTRTTGGLALLSHWHFTCKHELMAAVKTAINRQICLASNVMRDNIVSITVQFLTTKSCTRQVIKEYWLVNKQWEKARYLRQYNETVADSELSLTQQSSSSMTNHAEMLLWATARVVQSRHRNSLRSPQTEEPSQPSLSNSTWQPRQHDR